MQENNSMTNNNRDKIGIDNVKFRQFGSNGE